MSGGQAASGVTLRQDLMSLVEEIQFEDLNLTADTIAVPAPVAEVTGYWPVLPREVRMKVPDTRRQADGSFNRDQWDWNSDSYLTYEYGFEEPVDMTSQEVNERFINQEAIAASLAWQKLLLGRESRVATALMNTTTFTGATNTVAVAEEWDDAANAVAWANIDAAAIILRGKTGYAKRSMSLIITDDNLDYVMRSTNVIANIKYTRDIETMPREGKRRWFAEYLGIKEVLETSAIYDTSKLGGTFSATTAGKFWSNEYGMLCILDRSPSMMQTGVIKQPVFSQYAQDYVMESYEEPAQRKLIIRAREYRGIKVNADYGVLLTNMKTTVGTGGI